MAKPTIPVARIEARIREIDRRLEELERLKIEREALRRLLDSGPRRSEAASSEGVSLPGPAEAVRRVLREGGPLTAKEIVGRAKKQVDSRAENVERTLYSTIHNLKKKEIEAMEDGRLRLRSE